MNPAKFLNEFGVTAFVLKHRLPRKPSSPYSLEIHSRQNAQRVMRIIRSRAAEWSLDTSRISVMGFSAGGEVVAILVYSPTEGNAESAAPHRTGQLPRRFPDLHLPRPPRHLSRPHPGGCAARLLRRGQ